MDTKELLIRRAEELADYVKDRYGDHSEVALMRLAIEQAKAERAPAAPAEPGPMDETDWIVIKRVADLVHGSQLGRALDRLLAAVHDEPEN